MRALLLLLLLLPYAQAADWPRFRGPNGVGVAESGAYPDTLDPAKAVWRTEIPLGKSSPAIAGDRIFLTGHCDETLLTFALDRGTGRLLWTKEAPTRRLEKLNRLNDEASATPVTDGQNVYVFFGGYGLLSYTRDGKERWRLPLGPFTNFHGMGASPVLADGKVLMVCDQDIDAHVLAVDAETGKIAWRADRPDMVHSFSTPTVYRPANGTPQLLVPGSYQLVSYAIADGHELWRRQGLTYQVKSVAVLEGDRLYFNGWAPGGEPDQRIELPTFPEALEQLDKNGDQRLSKDEVPQEWQPSSWDMQDLNKDGVFDAKDWQYYAQRRTSTNSTMALDLHGDRQADLAWQSQRNMPDVPGVLVYQGVLYLIKNGAILTTLNPEDGSLLSQGRVREALDNYYASPVAGDGKVYLASEKGLVTILDAGPTPRPRATVDFGEAIFATPALLDGRVYLRSQSHLYCFGTQSD
ncbi:MAG: PQQ-binding-like beta-propeller repeat protein [Bryobacterales bacterium]